MPEEPEHNLDKPLRALAEKRRQEAAPGFDLHPANRRLLQDEVRKHYRKPNAPARSWWTGLMALWPRLAVALGIFVALGFLVLQMNPDRPEEMSMAQAESENRDRVEEPSRKSDAAKSEMSRDSAVPLSRAKTEPEDEPTPLAQQEIALTETRSTDALPPAAAEPPAFAASSERLYLGESVVQTPSEGIRLRRQSAPPPRRVSALPEVADASPVVLIQFQLIQDSNRIRIIDADGSVYEGPLAAEAPLEEDTVAGNKVQILAEEPAPELGRSFAISAARSAAPATGSPVAGSNAWRFVVSGTNRTIDLPIRLSGLLYSNRAGIVLEQTRQEADGLAEAIAPNDDRTVTFTVEGLLQIGTNEPQEWRASQILP